MNIILFTDWGFIKKTISAKDLLLSHNLYLLTALISLNNIVSK